ncbi:MAG TPA: hypothetical protein VFU43_14420 [Streptosporangiaceae bacterium]|nr:hypothetical protein [Streptosporangiaceae bacterium]
MIPIIILGLTGVIAAPAYLVYFALASRHDPLTPYAQGRSARWARRAVGVSVYRNW